MSESADSPSPPQRQPVNGAGGAKQVPRPDLASAQSLRERARDTSRQAEQVIRDSRILAAEVERLLEEGRRVLAAQGMDTASLLDNIRRTQGEAAVTGIEQEVQSRIREIEDEVARDRLHAAKPTSSSRPRAVRRTI